MLDDFRNRLTEGNGLDVAHRRLDRARRRLAGSGEDPGEARGDGAPEEATPEEGRTPTGAPTGRRRRRRFCRTWSVASGVAGTPPSTPTEGTASRQSTSNPARTARPVPRAWKPRRTPECSVARVASRNWSNAATGGRWHGFARSSHETNTTGRPLPNVLARAGVCWRELRAGTLADLVLSVSPRRRLFVPMLRERSFVDQRFMWLRLTDDHTDTDLCHALLNSIVGLFLAEALGFGRGLGALDPSTTRAKRQPHSLNSHRLNEKQQRRVTQAFRPLLDRPVETVPEELARDDRRALPDRPGSLRPARPLRADPHRPARVVRPPHGGKRLTHGLMPRVAAGRTLPEAPRRAPPPAH